MGLLDKLRNELIDIIEWIDDSRHTIAWRFPRYHNQIKNGAQLIVRPGQVAVFVHRGDSVFNATVAVPAEKRAEACAKSAVVASPRALATYPFLADTLLVCTK